MKKIIKTTGAITMAVLPFLSIATNVLAQDDTNSFNLSPGGQFGELANITLPAIVRSFIVLAMVLAGIIAFGFLVYGGIVWITSAGDKTKTETARNTITAALVGLLIVFGSWAIIKLAEMFFGICVLQLNLLPFSAQGT